MGYPGGIQKCCLGMLKQNYESQSSAGVGISEGCEGPLLYINMEGRLRRMWAPLRGVGSPVTKNTGRTEVHSVLPLLQVLTGEVCAEIFGQSLGSEVLPTKRKPKLRTTHPGSVPDYGKNWTGFKDAG